MLPQQENHTMTLENIYPTGNEEWFCPTCGRRVLLKYLPRLDILVLNEGDTNALHNGSQGGLQILSTTLEPADQNVDDGDQFPDDTDFWNRLLGFLDN